MDQSSELLPITKEELESRLKRVRSSLHSTAACALVVSTEANFVYLTDLRFDPLWSSPTRSLILVVRVEGPPTFILPSFVAEEARSKWPDAEIRAYEAPPERVVHRLLETLATCPPGPVAFELEPESRVGISLEDWAVLQASLGREVIDGQRLLWHARLRKSSSELQRLRLASHATSAAFQSLFEQELSGRSERELARSLLASALAAGADRGGVDWHHFRKRILCTIRVWPPRSSPGIGVTVENGQTPTIWWDGCSSGGSRPGMWCERGAPALCLLGLL